MNREIEAVQWMVENQNYYIVKESAKQDFQELVKYGSNIHTYTAEALSAYHKIQEKFLNNPYLYGTTYNWQPQKEKKIMLFIRILSAVILLLYRTRRNNFLFLSEYIDNGYQNSNMRHRCDNFWKKENGN